MDREGFERVGLQGEGLDGGSLERGGAKSLDYSATCSGIIDPEDYI